MIVDLLGKTFEDDLAGSIPFAKSRNYSTHKAQYRTTTTPPKLKWHPKQFPFRGHMTSMVKRLFDVDHRSEAVLKIERRVITKLSKYLQDAIDDVRQKSLSGNYRIDLILVGFEALDALVYLSQLPISRNTDPDPNLEFYRAMMKNTTLGA